MVFELIEVTDENSALTSPGAQLKRARENARIALQTVSKQSKIPIHKLEHLEADNYSALGASIFVKGYIRQYAQYVGIDADKLVEQYEQSSVPELMDTKVGVPNMAHNHWVPAPWVQKTIESIKGAPLWGVLVTILVIWLLAVTLLSGHNSEDEKQIQADDVVSESTPVHHSEPVLIEDVLPEVEISPEVDAVEEAAVLQELSLEQLDTTIESFATETEVADIQLDEAVLTFSEDCWVELTSVNGERLLAGLKKAGESVVISGVAPFNIMLGNARAVTLMVNGKIIATDPGPRRNTMRLLAGP